jgi:3',5'-cyclic AMP phosphodiesterase CpdA
MSRTVLHLSDLHFGKIDAQVLYPLVTTIAELSPDVIAVSGDLTQRAKPIEFQQAREFLDRLFVPLVVVPGNHDVPLFNPYRRFIQRFDHFHRHITAESVPEFIDGEIAVIGINTARSLTWKWGRVNRAQMTQVRDRLFALPAHVVRIVVMHHPFELPEGVSKLELVGRARMGMDKLAECGADVLLSGHLHSAHISDTVRRYNIYGHSALVVQAGTATSTRQRGEQNSFNILRIDASEINIESWTWRGPQAGITGGFHQTSNKRFTKRDRLWIPASEV